MEFASQFLIENTTAVVLTKVALCPQSYMPFVNAICFKFTINKIYKIIIDFVTGTQQSTYMFPGTYLIQNAEHHLIIPIPSCKHLQMNSLSASKVLNCYCKVSFNVENIFDVS